MTKAEFYEQVHCINDLLDFCYEYDFEEIVDGIKSSDYFDDWVWDNIDESRPSLYWHEIRDMLNDLEAPGGDYFKITGRLEYEDVYESDLPSYMREVIDMGEDIEFWDDGSEDEWIPDDTPVKNEDPGDVCWDVSVDLSVLIGAG